MADRIEAVNDAQPSEAAERYASAAFDLALEQGALDALDQDFKLLTAAFKESADLRAAAGSPLIEPAEKARAIVAVANKIGLSLLGRNLVGVASSNGRARELPAIAKAFAKRLAVHRHARQVEIISAAPLGATELDGILAGLKTALGQDIQSATRVDESLIGGFIVRAGSRQFDASIKSKLESLKLALKTA